MKFELTEDQRLLDQAIEEMLRSELSQDVFRGAVYGKGELNRSLWKAAADFGLCGLLVPEAFGGSGFGLVEATIAAQRTGHSSLPLPLIDHLVATAALSGEVGELSAELLPCLATGELIACCAIEDAQDSLSDAYSCKMVEFFDDADVLLVCSLSDGVGLVDLRKVVVESEDSCSVDLSRPSKNIIVPKESVHILEAVSVEHTLQAMRILQAADSWGISRFIIETASEYAVTRKQFGRLIGEFQSVKHPLAEMAMVQRLSEPMLWSSASLWEVSGLAYEEAALLCKAHITESCVKAVRECIQLMGAYGFSWESDLHIWYKRSLSNSVRLGSPRECRASVARLRNWEV